MSAAGKNLEAIVAAMDRHDRTCANKLIEVRMNPFEVERLGWDEIRGVPVVSDPEIGTGRFHLVCGGDHEKDEQDTRAYDDVPVTA